MQYSCSLGKKISQERCSIRCLPSALTATQTRTLNPQESDKKGVLDPHLKSEEADVPVNVNLSDLQLHSGLENVNIEVERQ